jgi:serine/threonine protein kinase
LRDLKPENVIRTPSGVVKILDFGLARSEHAVHSRLTMTGVIVGTPAYLAPEQVLGQQADFRTDLFALGLLLYELASGTNPFVDRLVSWRGSSKDPPPLSPSSRGRNGSTTSSRCACTRIRASATPRHES